MPATDLIVHTIPTVPRAKPRIANMPLFTEEEKQWQKETLPQLIKSGVLAPCRSNWSAKPKFVRKTNGRLRMVNAFNALNNNTIKDAYPMRRMEPIVDALGQEKIRVLFQCDAANGYYAVPNHIDDAYKTAFPTYHGQLCYLRMGQGLTTAPRTYSKLKDTVFGVIPAANGEEPALADVHPNVVCQYFMDDNLGGATTVDELIWFLHEHYFPRIAWAHLTLSPSKCRFFTNNIKVLGLEKSEHGIRPSADKREVIGNYPIPRDTKELEHFLNLLPYLSDCIPGRADLARVMQSAGTSTRHMATVNGRRQRVVTEGEFKWTADCQTAFERAKKAIVETAVVGGDPQIQYHRATDASGTGAGGVLIQLKGHPPGTHLFDTPMEDQKVVKFLSFKFTDVQTRYHTTKREFLSLLLCAEKCRHLICGSPFPVKVYTDHMAIIHILANADNGHGQIAQWQYKLGEYNMDVIHVPGKLMKVADGLSRLRQFPEMAHGIEEVGMQAFVMEEVGLIDEDRWAKWLKDDYFGPIIRYKLTGTLPGMNDPTTYSRNVLRKVAKQACRFTLVDLPEYAAISFVERNGALARCVLPEDKEEVLQLLHDTHGHFAFDQTLSQSIGKFYWPSRAKDIALYCQTCHDCQMLGPLRPNVGLLPVLQLQPLDMIGLDFMGPISPRSDEGDRYILIVVDYCTRYLWCTAMPRCTSLAVWEYVSHKIFPTFGFPRSTYTDNGSHFTGKQFPKEMKKLGVRLITAPPGAPSSVGLSESFVKMVKKGLQALLQKDTTLTGWAKKVSAVRNDINGRIIKKWKHSPNELMLGFSPRRNPKERSLEDDIRSTFDESLLIKAASENTSMGEHFKTRLARLDEVRERAIEITAQHQQAQHRKSDPRWVSPKQGELVLLRRYRLDTQKGKKLEPRWIGPYILESLSPNGRSGWLKSLHTEANIGRHHLNNLKLYLAREDSEWMNQARRTQEMEQRWAAEPEDTASDDVVKERQQAESNLLPNHGVPVETEDTFLHWITHPLKTHAEERDPAYWLRKQVDLRSLL